ncbi:C-C motif chemokine 28 [Ambystoma mexicanum]|uniref:C-C motif chemokine 28 n=1 Tax=Ambystoma mexicanum TaxID=8296 RepID=UPI0037E93D72
MNANVLALLALLVCCFQLSNAINSRGISCCTEVGNHISRKILSRVQRCEIQREDGLCNIAAVVLYTKKKTLCVNPKNKHVRKWRKFKCGGNKRKNYSATKRSKTKRRRSKTRKRI